MFKASILVEAGNWKKEVPGIEKILNKNFKKIFSSLKSLTIKISKCPYC